MRNSVWENQWQADHMARTMSEHPKQDGESRLDWVMRCAKIAGFDEVEEVPPPPKTDTWSPFKEADDDLEDLVPRDRIPGEEG